MSQVREIFQNMPARYLPPRSGGTRCYYFSVGDEKWTVTMFPDRCEAVPGKAVAQADVVLKCDPDLFVKMVLHGKMPGPLDIARGKIKTNDPSALTALKERFKI